MQAITSDNKPLPLVVCLMGPTAAGKTDTAFYLHEQFDCQIVSVDSALVYKGMDIGTAKPTPAELAKVPHHLVDICDPSEPYSAADFAKDARQAIDSIVAKGQLPVLVGGTMLYYKALQQGLSELPAADQVVRDQIESMAAEHGWSYVHQQLAKVDPVAAERIHPNDPQRLQRALEVYQVSGKSHTDWCAEKDCNKIPYEFINIALAPTERSILHQRIEQRFELMLEQGFDEEVRKLYNRGDLHPNLPAIRSVGYRQMWSYLAGEIDFAEMKYRSIVATRQLAKRQYTWLRSWPELHWVDSLIDDKNVKVQVLVEQRLDYNTHPPE